MKKILVFLIMIVIIFSCSKREKPEFVIGISQIVSHNALDSAREGFKSVFKDVNVKFVETNANGDISTLELNTKKLVTQNVNLIYAIATPSAQLAQNSTESIPIVFSAVTDAKKANINKENVTGILDAAPIEKQIDLLLTVKNDIKKVGIIYNSSEQNSVFQAESLKEILKVKNIELVEKTVTQINEISQTITSLAESVDAIYTPADNLVASSINIISEQLIESNKISIGAEKAHVDAGILMTLGIDYYELGVEAGKIALSILKEGKKPSDFEIKGMENLKFEYNKNTSEKLGVKF